MTCRASSHGVDETESHAGQQQEQPAELSFITHAEAGQARCEGWLAERRSSPVCRCQSGCSEASRNFALPWDGVKGWWKRKRASIDRVAIELPVLLVYPVIHIPQPAPALFLLVRYFGLSLFLPSINTRHTPKLITVHEESNFLRRAAS